MDRSLEPQALQALAGLPADLWGLLTDGRLPDAAADDAARDWVRGVEAAFPSRAALAREIVRVTGLEHNCVVRRFTRLDEAETRTLGLTALTVVAALRAGLGLPELVPDMDAPRHVWARTRWAGLCLFAQSARQAARAAGYNDSYLRVCAGRGTDPSAPFLRALAASDEGREGGLDAGWLLTGEGEPLACRVDLLCEQEHYTPALATSS